MSKKILLSLLVAAIIFLIVVMVIRFREEPVEVDDVPETLPIEEDIDFEGLF